MFNTSPFNTIPFNSVIVTVHAGKPTTSYTTIPKPTTPYDKTVKPLTGFLAIAKPATDYDANVALEAGVRLDSMTVTLGSLTVYLSGYTTATPPLASTKPQTVYEAVARPTTSYAKV